MLLINAVNGIVDSLYASNLIEQGQAAMSAIGLYGPINHFLFAITMLFVSGSQILYGRFLAQDRERINSIFTIDLLISAAMGLLTSGIMVVGVYTGGTQVLVKQEPELGMLNQYILGQAFGIPDSFGVSDDERIDITVRNMEQVMKISDQVIQFCNARGIDGRRSYFAGLCMEEMAGNVITYGFENAKRHRSVDIRVVHDGNEIILRIRDNCSAFNPSEFVKAMEADESGHNIGIRLAYKLAKEVTYQNLLGLNVLTMRI